ncbi:iron complex transport system substrate-binding protein [Spinactinospora alkalitolerans]|uniref:Iron complex transport system substrate-binding protein n=1 Tax=Spinactinospora alkalitolerans TaxID=687207 RepID=A0A852TT41_9ACTN|nr:ABC transporter substrate-binding protein [Spinactinospora alkalitolerans]NYE45284.1 iron complex transport system substrate-binding protein [Spinactinospora alkalitolerans]
MSVLRQEPAAADRARRTSVARPHLLLALVAAGLLAVPACATGGDPGAASADGGATRAVRTDKGEVEIPAEPRRVLSLNASLTGDLLSLGAPVAATSTGMSGGVRYDADGFPVHWRGAAQEAGVEILSDSAEISLEAVAAADPDLIVAGGVGRPMAAAEELHDRLGEIAPTVFLDSSDNDWQEQLTALGGVLGAEDRAEELIDGYEERVTEVTAAATLPEQPTSVALDAETVQTLHDGAPGVRLLTDFGFEPAPLPEDAVPDAPTKDWIEVSEEEISEVFTGESLLLYEGRATTPLSELAADSLWSRLPSFENGRAHGIPVEARRPDYLAAMYTADWVEEEFGPRP